MTPAVSKHARRGGAAAAPRARRVAPKKEASEASPKKAAADKEAKPTKKVGKTASKLGKALRRKKSEE